MWYKGIYVFHLSSDVNFSPNRYSKQKSSLRGKKLYFDWSKFKVKPSSQLMATPKENSKAVLE